MAKTLIIYDASEKEQIHTGTFLLFDTYDRFCVHYFLVQHPDGKQEKIKYASVKRINRGEDEGYPSLDAEQRMQRDLTLQKIVNKLESEGYRINSSQLALFMSSKIKRLIMDRRL